MPRGYGSSRSFSPGANTRERAAQSNRFSGGGYSSTTTRTRPTPTKTKKKPLGNFKPIAIKIIEGVTSSFKKSKQNVMDYEGQAAGVTPMRNPFPTRGGGGNDRDPQYKPTTTIKPITPTTAEVSQATAATSVAPVTTPEEIAETEETRKRRTKRRGRSLTILTGSSGVTGGLTLGIPSLLGR